MPREGHDAQELINGAGQAKFQSTCPARGTTARRLLYDYSCQNFNPRAPRGARLDCYAAGLCPVLISIHVPREGHDYSYMFSRNRPSRFQSTCPARGTTDVLLASLDAKGISIHVPREGHDL